MLLTCAKSIAEVDGLIKRHPLLNLTLWRPISSGQPNLCETLRNVFCYSLLHIQDFFANTTKTITCYFVLMCRHFQVASRRHEVTFVVVNYVLQDRGLLDSWVYWDYFTAQKEHLTVYGWIILFPTPGHPIGQRHGPKDFASWTSHGF